MSSVPISLAGVDRPNEGMTLADGAAPLDRRIRIGFVLLSSASDPIPSTRIAVLNMLPHLRNAGFDPAIVFDPKTATEAPDLTAVRERLRRDRFDIVYFQKVHGPSVLNLARELSAAGVRTVFGVCDVVDADMAAATDATITVTDHLKSLYPAALHARISTVHDGIERPALHKTDWSDHRGSRARPLRAVLVTSVALDRLPVIKRPPEWLRVQIVGRYPARDDTRQRLRETRWQWARLAGSRSRLDYLRFLADRRIERTAWGADSVYAAMAAADIGIIPIETDPAHGAIERWQVKSENRLTLKMAMALPVVATPIPAYEPVVRHGKNAFLARNGSEWLDQLEALRDPALRRSIGLQARETALQGYSTSRQAARLVDVLRRLVTADAGNPLPKVQA